MYCKNQISHPEIHLKIEIQEFYEHIIVSISDSFILILTH